MAADTVDYAAFIEANGYNPVYYKCGADFPFGFWPVLPAAKKQRSNIFCNEDAGCIYIYQALMQNSDYAMSSAASFYQSIVGFVLIVAANALVRKYEKSSAIF